MSITIENGRLRYCGTGVDISPEDGNTELYIMGEFVCGWPPGVKPDITEIIKQSVKWGETLKQREINKVLGR